MLRKRRAKDPARTAGQSGDLLTERLEIGGALVTDLKNREPAKADDARRRWYVNADAISAFLAGINACWNEEKWREFFYSHLEMTAKRPRCACRATMRPTSACSTGSRPRRLRMAAYMFCGLAMRCR